MYLDIAKLRIGDKVHYQPKYYDDAVWENGIIKEIPTHTNKSVRVVYNCAGNWDKYMDYTSALTSLADLKMHWRH